MHHVDLLTACWLGGEILRLRTIVRHSHSPIRHSPASLGNLLHRLKKTAECQLCQTELFQRNTTCSQRDHGQMSVTPRPSLQHENSFHDHKIKQKNTEPGARPYQRSSRHLDRVPSATPKPPQKNETSLAHNCRALNQLSSQHYSEKPEAYYPWTLTLW